MTLVQSCRRHGWKPMECMTYLEPPSYHCLMKSPPGCHVFSGEDRNKIKKYKPYLRLETAWKNRLFSPRFFMERNGFSVRQRITGLCAANHGSVAIGVLPLWPVAQPAWYHSAINGARLLFEALNRLPQQKRSPVGSHQGVGCTCWLIMVA